MLGLVHRLHGEFGVAINSYQEALTVLPDAGPRSVLPRADILINLGDTYQAAGDQQAARHAWRDALQILDDIHHPGAKQLAVRLGDLGQREEALAAIQEAVTIRRELAAARPDAFRPDLASSLNNLAIRLGDLGQREEALAAIQEAAGSTGSWPPDGQMPTTTS
jgi:tetratricopeptide (TPR) repeat protein